MGSLLIGMVIVVVAIWYIKEVIKGYKEVGIIKSKNHPTREYNNSNNDIDWTDMGSPVYDKTQNEMVKINLYYDIEDSTGIRNGGHVSRSISKELYDDFVYDRNYNGGSSLETWMKNNCIGEIARQQPKGDFRLKNIQITRS